ncbi:hypothetical protein Barb7_02143 [Bacteroidales bacterium Barb7]|nr:hypothetical protein Barb7_02143 [Bacteroidales bacterium Barb7]
MNEASSTKRSEKTGAGSNLALGMVVLGLEEVQRSKAEAAAFC